MIAGSYGKVDCFVVLFTLGADHTLKNKKDKTCFDKMSAKNRLAILTRLQLSLSVLEANHHFMWFILATTEEYDNDHDGLYPALLRAVESLVSNHPTLAAAKDGDGRAVIDVASKPMKLIMQSILLWHGRYRITDQRPEHASNFCYVFKAVDESIIDSETQQPIKVALKLMRLKAQFLRESEVRSKNFSHDFVVNALQQLVPTQSKRSISSATLSSLATSSQTYGGVYRPIELGVYSMKLLNRGVVANASSDPSETKIYRLRSINPTQLIPHYRCSKHEHELSPNPLSLSSDGCNVCLQRKRSSSYMCAQCNWNICETCFNHDNNHQELTQGTIWLLTMQEGNDVRSEVELARSQGPTVRVFDAVFSSIKVDEGIDGTVNVVDIVVVDYNNQTADDMLELDVDSIAGQLTKNNAEKFYFLVMPLAERNLFVALKQERWVGKNLGVVRHVFTQLVHCVDHMHDKGVLHADIKPLNIVRTGGQWKLIDLDASCEIGKEHVGHKSSSAYVPPEAIYVADDHACVRSIPATMVHPKYDLLMAHPSFDVWSLGCILYQMCTPDVIPLFQGGQDDNLRDDLTEEDNLFALAAWTPWKKAKKLLRVENPSARNLLGQMLHKDPLQRPTLARVLAHPFVSGRKVARLVGEKPKYDVFLSYRVAADLLHAEKLYNLLTAQGFKVYWDKVSLLPGEDWEQGFIEGLVSSRAFVPLLSRDAINHPDKAWQNLSTLTSDSDCDNVFLEYRLAVELQGLGLIEKMCPIFIGDVDKDTKEYSHYYDDGCHPSSLPEVAVMSVEEKLRLHLENQALGTPMENDRTVASVVKAITDCQGAFIHGPLDATFDAAVSVIFKMLRDVRAPLSLSSRLEDNELKDHKTLIADVEVNELQSTVDNLTRENITLKGELDNVRSRQEAALVALKTGDFTSVAALSSYLQGLLQG